MQAKKKVNEYKTRFQWNVEIWKRIKVGESVDAPPLKKYGTNQYNKNGVNNVNSSLRGGNDKTYILRRLKRDAFSTVERMG